MLGSFLFAQSQAYREEVEQEDLAQGHYVDGGEENDLLPLTKSLLSLAVPVKKCSAVSKV